MKLFTIWLEGAKLHETTIKASWMGKVQAESFQEACDKMFNNWDDQLYYNKRDLTYSGRRLFENEDEARESFG